MPSWNRRAPGPVFLTALLLAACQDPNAAKDSGGDASLDGGSGEGIIFKGPMSAGSEIRVQPLGPDGQPDGDPVVTAVSAEDGSYSFALERQSLVEVTAIGTVFSEAEGAPGSATVEMKALGEVGSSAAPLNVNAATDLTYKRVGNLMSEGATFQEATAQAIEELKAALPIGVEGAPDAPGTGTDPYGEGYEQSWLFALSCVLAQMGKDAADAGSGDIPDVLSALRDDLADDGQILPAVTEGMRVVESRTDPDLALWGLMAHMEDHSLSRTLPDPHPALDTDHDGIANSDDNCRYVSNEDQSEELGLGFGDACDYRMKGIATTDEWGCGILESTGELSCWQVNAPPTGGSPPRPDDYPAHPGLPWEGGPGLLGSFEQVSVAKDIVCGINEESAALCWTAVGGIFEVGIGMQKVVAGDQMICALGESGSVTCLSPEGEAAYTTPPLYKDLAPLGGSGACMVETLSGAVVCAGPDGIDISATVGVPTGSFVSIAASGREAGWACAMDEAGHLTCFGSGVMAASAPESSNYVGAALGEGVACAWWEDGRIECWRDEERCPEVTEAPPLLWDISAGTCQVCGTDEDGLGLCWPRYWDQARAEGP